jgi:hypothetical protein
VQCYVDVEVSSEEVYHEEEDVVCSKSIVPFEGMEFDSVEEARRVYNDYAFNMGFSIRVGSSGTILLPSSLLGRNLSVHMLERQLVSERTTLQPAR